jgi:hypothetical protein
LTDIKCQSFILQENDYVFIFRRYILIKPDGKGGIREGQTGNWGISEANNRKCVDGERGLK